jgi:hypothetical protein
MLFVEGLTKENIIVKLKISRCRGYPAHNTTKLSARRCGGKQGTLGLIAVKNMLDSLKPKEEFLVHLPERFQ